MTKQLDISSAAAALGRKGGSSTSEAKQAAARANGKRGGRPRKESTMNYNVAVYKGSFSNQLDGETAASEKKAETAAKRLAKKYPDCQVYVSWHRSSDDQHGYLNPGGNHDITGKPW